MPFTPVPAYAADVLGAYSSALLWAALVGPLSMALYLLAGVAGVPWFAGHHSGWALPSFGYIVGFVAAGLAGRAACRDAALTVGSCRPSA